MANQPLQVIKAVSALPSPLAPNTFYLVRVNQGYDLYATDTTGSNAYKINVSPNQLTDVIAVAQGGTGGTDALTARTNLGLGTAATKNITTSAYDKTANNVLKVGDFGIGGNAIMTANIISSATAQGFYDAHKSNGGAFFCGLALDINGKKPPNYFNYLVSGLAGGGVFAICGDVNSGDFFVISGCPEYGSPVKLNYIYHDGNTSRSDVLFKSLQSGSASYKKGWRKLTATLPSQAGEITKAHGVTNIEMLQAKVTASDSIVSYQNDPDPTRQFYIRVIGANLVLGVASTATAILGQPVTIYVGEEL